MAEHFSANITVAIAVPAAHKLDAHVTGETRWQAIGKRGEMTIMHHVWAPNLNLAEGAPCVHPIPAKHCPASSRVSIG